MIVGCSRAERLIRKIKRLQWGRMMVVGQGTFQPYECEPWAWDCGAYYMHKNSIPWDDGRFWAEQAKAEGIGTPLFAVCPDIVAGGADSLRHSLKYMEQLQSHNAWMGRWYLAVQDGMDVREVEREMLPFAGLFLGGSDEFKQTALAWSLLAHRYGKRFHYGRAGTMKKVRWAKYSRADSLDSSFPLWNYGRFDDFAHWVTEPDPQTELFSLDGEKDAT